MNECPVLKIPCPQARPPAKARLAGLARIIAFWSGLVTGADQNASMAKALAWATFALIAASWFYFPERSITELAAIFAALLSYIFGGKWAWRKYRKS